VFLTIFPGAKATAMGAAFTGVADDATVSYYNPGALGFFKKTEFSLIHAPWLRALATDMYYEYMGFAKPLGSTGTLGGHLIYLTLGEIVAIDQGGTEVGRFRPYDFAFNLSYGFELNEKVGIGMGANVIHSFLAPGEIIREVLGEPGGGGSATSFAFNAGVLYHGPFRINLGASLMNLGPGLKYTESGETDPLPHTLRLGASWRPVWNKYHKVTLAADLNKVLVGIADDYRDFGLSYVFREAWKHVGAEYTFSDFVSLRVGYFYDHYGLRKGLTFGGGIKFKNFKLDVADDSRIYDFEESSNRRFALSYVLQN
jgi:hypothetical protein